MQVYGIVILTSISSTACGILICEWLITNFSLQNKALKIGSGFLVGTSFLLVTTHILSLLITNAKISYGSFGSLHSGRYANISLDIISSNQIAKIPQNIGESMLAVFAMLLGFYNPN